MEVGSLDIGTGYNLTRLNVGHHQLALCLSRSYCRKQQKKEKSQSFHLCKNRHKPLHAQILYTYLSTIRTSLQNNKT